MYMVSRPAAACTAMLLGLALARPLSAQITKSGGGYLFRQRYVKGQAYRYVVTSSTKQPGAKSPIKTTLPMVMTVLQVQNHVATLHMVVGPFTANGRAMGSVQKLDFKIDDRNNIIGPKPPGLDAPAMVLPEKPLRVGQSFDVSTKLNLPMGQSLTVHRTSTFQGVKTVGGRRVAQMAITQAGSGTMQIRGKGTSLLDVSDGSVVSENMTQQVTLSQGPQPMTLQSTSTIARK